MKPIEFLIHWLIKMFFGKSDRARAGEKDKETEETYMGSRGVETRCVNPDIGCLFEVS
jgi:hypothetical protein